jgi:hypothetical protein
MWAVQRWSLRALSSVVERRPYKAEVAGSKPAAPTHTVQFTGPPNTSVQGTAADAGIRAGMVA